MQDQTAQEFEAADAQFQAHLAEIRRTAAERAERERAQCEAEYKRYNERFLRSMGNHEIFVREKRRTELETSQSLFSLERRLNDGCSRSLQRKEQVRLSARATL